VVVLFYKLEKRRSTAILSPLGKALQKGRAMVLDSRRR